MESVYFMVYRSSPKDPEQETIIELPFNKGVKYNLLTPLLKGT